MGKNKESTQGEGLIQTEPRKQLKEETGRKLVRKGPDGRLGANFTRKGIRRGGGASPKIAEKESHVGG